MEVTLADNAYKGDDLDMWVAKRDSVSDHLIIQVCVPDMISGTDRNIIWNNVHLEAIRRK